MKTHSQKSSNYKSRNDLGDTGGRLCFSVYRINRNYTKGGHRYVFFNQRPYFKQGGRYNKAFSFAAIQTFFSPGMLLLFMTGLFFSLKKRNYRLLVLGLISLILSAPFIYSGVAKQFIYSLPGFIAVCAYAIVSIWNIAVNTRPVQKWSCFRSASARQCWQARSQERVSSM